MVKKCLICIIFCIALLFVAININATTYFYFDAEDEVVDAILPLYVGAPANFCQTECGGSGEKGTTQSSGGAPQGDKYFRWDIVDSQHDCRTEVASDTTPPPSGWSVTLSKGVTYYLAYFNSFEPTGEEDIWEEGSSKQSGDKGVELVGDDIRINVSRGQWSNYVANDDHYHTVWASVLKGDNEDTEWGQSLNGYSLTNPIQLGSEWYAIVLEFTISDNDTGVVIVRVNGVKTEEYTDLNTIESPYNMSVGKIQMGGTMAQPLYNCGAHYRKFDALILTDVWQDIIDGGYLSDPEENGNGGESSTGSIATGVTF